MHLCKAAEFMKIYLTLLEISRMIFKFAVFWYCNGLSAV